VDVEVCSLENHLIEVVVAPDDLVGLLVQACDELEIGAEWDLGPEPRSIADLVALIVRCAGPVDTVVPVLITNALLDAEFERRDLLGRLCAGGERDREEGRRRKPFHG